MGRPHSPGHLQSVIEAWRERLLAIPVARWERAGAARSLAAAVLGRGLTSSDPQWRRYATAAKDLGCAIRAAEADAARPDPLDAWIKRHLVLQGTALLIPEEMRRAALARVRDTHRRRTRAEEGVRAARIEMRQAAWDKLELIRAQLQQNESNQLLSLGATLERVVAAYDAGLRPPAPRKRLAARHQAMEPDLLTELEPGR